MSYLQVNLSNIMLEWWGLLDSPVVGSDVLLESEILLNPSSSSTHTLPHSPLMQFLRVEVFLSWKAACRVGSPGVVGGQFAPEPVHPVPLLVHDSALVDQVQRLLGEGLFVGGQRVLVGDVQRVLVVLLVVVLNLQTVGDGVLLEAVFEVRVQMRVF